MPVAICALPHMGLLFSRYMILYMSLYFGWKHPPASRSVISPMLLQYVSSFVPSDWYSMVRGA